MSLTSHLRNPSSPIVQFFRHWFSQTSIITKATNSQLRSCSTIVPPAHPWPYDKIGMAIDYRIRYSFGITPRERLVAWKGAWELMSVADRWLLADHELNKGRATRIPNEGDEDVEGVPTYTLKVIEELFDGLDATLNNIRPVGRRLEPEAESLLARYCFVLALFEEVFRSDRYKDGPLMVPTIKQGAEELLASVEDAWVDDVCSLSWLFYDRYHHLFSPTYTLNPLFAGSNDVGGADADLIVDGCLIEIKTSKQQKIDPDWLRQLAGYVLLDYNDSRHITSVALYMARQGLLLQWSVTDILRLLTGNDTITWPQLRQEFRAVCQNMQQQASENEYA